MPLTNSRRLASSMLAAGVAVAVVVSVTVLSGSSEPFEHTECVRQATLATEVNRWIVAVLINSPFGGTAFGMGRLPTLQGVSWDLGTGAGSLNGTAIAAYRQGVSVELYSVENRSIYGLGPQRPCASDLQISFSDIDGYAITATFISTESNLSDEGESNDISVWNVSTNPSYEFSVNNGFEEPNYPTVSTCGGTRTIDQVRSSWLTVGIPFSAGNQTLTVPYTFPIAQNFTYSFPANFGSWAVDNLSEPGGPGGGWAFDYLGPCPWLGGSNARSFGAAHRISTNG